MQERRDKLEGKTPLVPCTSKQPHRHNRLGDCPQCGCETGDEEDPAEEVVSIGEDAIENYSDVGEQLEHGIECTYAPILLGLQVNPLVTTATYTYPRQYREQTRYTHQVRVMVAD